MEFKNMVKAWDKERNQMCNVVFIDFIKPQIGLHCVGYGSYCQHPNDVIILRNIELKDKNGVEIYEGDILRLTKDRRNCIVTKGYFENYFGDGRFGLYLSHADKTLGYGIEIYSGISKDVIVIGNAYENQELVE